MSTYRRDGIQALFRGRRFNRGAAWGMIIIVALIAFEVSNFNATRFALRDLLGDLTFGGIRWATLLAIAFCGIDFAGIARIFTPEQGADEPKEVYYLFGAWFLAAVGRLACPRDNQPYVIPIYFALHGDYLYSFTTLGQKIARIFQCGNKVTGRPRNPSGHSVASS